MRWLLTTLSQEFQRTSFHGVEKEIMLQQAKGLRMEILLKAIPRGMEEYEKEFKRAVNLLKRKGLGGMVFGDIDLEEHREWVERVCKELEIEPVEPLWGEKQENLLREFVREGFQAVVVAAKAELGGENWVGKRVDKKFTEEVETLSRQGKLTPCGERGEYHTLCLGGPIFKASLEIIQASPVFKNGYWFLDIQRWREVL